MLHGEAGEPACAEIGRWFPGTLVGLLKRWGALAGFVSPMLIGWPLDLTGQNWNIPFYPCAAIYALGAAQ